MKVIIPQWWSDVETLIAECEAAGSATTSEEWGALYARLRETLPRVNMHIADIKSQVAAAKAAAWRTRSFADPTWFRAADRFIVRAKPTADAVQRMMGRTRDGAKRTQVRPPARPLACDDTANDELQPGRIKLPRAQWDFVLARATTAGVSVSEYLRALIDADGAA